MSNRLLAEKLQITTLQQANAIMGGLSNPSKMPGYAYNLPATLCPVGSRLRKVEGSVCGDCYALKGRYFFPRTKAALQRRYEALSHPMWVEAMVFAINFHAKKHSHFRWHDAGDLQARWHLDLIVEVCRRTPNVKHWMPTREIGLIKRYVAEQAFPPNLVVRVSAPMIGQAISGIPGIPTSTVGKPDFGLQCNARNQGGKCNACRACWSAADINYPHH